MTRVCKKCGLAKALAEFPPDARTNDGLSNRCGACRPDPREAACAASARWRKENSERVKRVAAEYRERNAVDLRAKDAARRASQSPERAAEQRKRDAAYAARYRRENPEDVKARKAEYGKTHAAEIAARTAKWARANSERVAEYQKSYRAKNATALRAKEKAWREANSAQVKERARAYSAKWFHENKARLAPLRKEWNRQNAEQRAHIIAGYAAKRRAIKRQAIPGWADLRTVNAIYAEARRLSRETGVPFHVDHEVPLNSPVVCGLHWEGNLQVLPAFANCMKSNRYWQDMPL